MASITKRNDGYSVRWRDPDGRARRRQAPTRTAARQLVREIDHAHALGRRWEPDGAGDVPTVDAVTDAFLADRQRVWAPSTIRTRAVWLAVWGEWAGTRTPIGLALTRERNAAHWSWMRTRGTAHTANLRIRLLEQLWRWVRDHEEWGDYVGRVRRLDLAPAIHPPTVAPTWAEVDRVIDLARRSRHVTLPWYRLLVVMRYTGLRSGQAVRLAWDDFDLEGRRLVIRPELGKSGQERRGRVVPISRHLTDEMATWGTRDGLVAPVPLVDMGTVRRWWTAAGVPEDRWRHRPLHSIRKAFVSGLRAAGADRDAVEYLVGHSLGIAGVYTDPASLPLEEAVELVARIGSDNVRRMRAQES